MFFAIPVSSLTGLFIVEVASKYVDESTIFAISSGLTFMNLVSLHFFDESPMNQKEEFKEINDSEEVSTTTRWI